MKILFFTTCLCFFLGFTSVVSQDESKEEKMAKNWEKVISTALEQKYVVRARIYMGRNEKIVDIDRVGCVLILTLKNKDKMAITMPFKTTDKDGHIRDLHFEFEK
ncbi:MAG: hypothetical protein COA79_06255 [Planctomycetota bacterium]|nr:MAG: hypothetical protein COA79_06255 [Planctomycetota bacterium]